MKCTKIYNARAQLLFCSLNLLCGDVLVAVAVVVCLSFLLPKAQQPGFISRPGRDRNLYWKSYRLIGNLKQKNIFTVSWILPHLRQFKVYSPLTRVQVELSPPHIAQWSYLNPESSLLSQPTD